MRYVRLSSSFFVLLALSVGATACRLGANNSEKLSALKSGEIYDEDGILSIDVSSPEAGTLINLANSSTSYAVSGTCSPDGSLVSILIDQAPAENAVEASCSDGKWTSSFDSTILADGTHGLSASIARNGKSKTSSEISFTKNTAVPQLAILSPSNNGFINASTNSATFALSGSCSETGQDVAVNVDGAAAAAQNGGTCNGSTWAATISTLGLSAGAHTLQVSIVSATGNPKTSEAVIVTKDITTPTAAISTPANNSYANIGNNSASFAVSGTCNDATASVQVKVDGSNSGSAASCGGVNWNATISTVALSQGVHTLTAQITDPAGNSAASSAIILTKDTVTPPVAITSPSTNGYINIGNNSASFAIQGSCTTADESGRTITIQVNGTNATQSAITCGASNAWSGTINTTSLGQGAHTLTALLADAAGNSNISTGITLTKDTSAPTVTLTSPVAGIIINASKNSTAYPIKGTCSENSSAVSVLVDGSAASGLASNTCSSGSFSATIDTTGLSSGAHTITATQTDAAGNAGPSTPPSVSITHNTALNLGGTFSRASTAYDTTTAIQAASGVARYSRISNATGMMIEENTTNLLTYTSEFDNAAWPKDQSLSVTANQALAPDGTMTADYAQFPTGTLARTWETVSGLAGKTVTFSVWARAVSGTVPNFGIFLRENSFGTTYGNTNVNLTTEWQRVTLTATIGAGSTSVMTLIYHSGTGMATWDVYLWGAQLEEKPYATSYVPTSASTATRSAEMLTIPTAGNLRPNQGAVVIRAYVDSNLLTYTGASRPFDLLNTYDGSFNNRLTIRRASGAATWQAITVSNAGVASTAGSNTVLTAGWHTFGMRYNPSELTLWIDGNKESTVNSPGLPTTLESTLTLGSYVSGSLQWNQPIDYAAFYQNSPTDGEMIAYTSTGPTDADNRLDFAGATFSRTSTASDYSTGAQAASGVARYATVGGSAGILIDESTTNLFSNADAETGTVRLNNTISCPSNSLIGQNTTKARSGSSSMILSATNTGAKYIQFGLNSNMNGLTAGQTYTLSAWVYVPSGLTGLSLGHAYLKLIDSVGSTDSASPTAYDTWERLTVTRTIDAGATWAQARLYMASGTTSGIYIYGDDFQIENKAYATSWHGTNITSARNAETLTIPTSGNIDSTQGAVAIRAYVSGDTALAIPSAQHTLFSFSTVPASATNVMTLNKHPNGNVYFTTSNDSGGSSSAGWNTALSTGWNTFLVRWSSSEISIWHGGTRQAYVNTPNLPVSLASNLYIGSYATGLAQWGQPIDWIAIYKTTPNDSQAAAISQGDISGADLKLDFNNSLGQ